MNLRKAEHGTLTTGYRHGIKVDLHQDVGTVIKARQRTNNEK